ncbi:MAG: cytochrome c oxidase subunit 3 [Alphaproteobacteria bacterium]|nr:cytochrome c oxidase subunit 3 [Alphaproteobacteria bacterium]
MAGTVNHDYHILEPDIWPLIGSLSALTFTTGMVLFMHEMGAAHLVLGLGIAGLIATFFSWFSNIVKEAERGDHTPVVQLHMRYGMILFIASEVMFFVAWFWGFFEFSIFAHARVGDTWDATNPLYADALARFKSWPPVGVETFDPFHLPLINTLVLLLSGTTVTWAHHALQHDDLKGAKLGLLLTLILGMGFTALQVIEYSEAGFTYDGTLYGSAFFMATGFHGAHVVIGTIFLAVCLMRLMMGGMSAKKHLGFEFAAWYWHFVDVVWLFLFAFVYVAPYLIFEGGK